MANKYLINLIHQSNINSFLGYALPMQYKTDIHQHDIYDKLITICSQSKLVYDPYKMKPISEVNINGFLFKVDSSIKDDHIILIKKLFSIFPDIFNYFSSILNLSLPIKEQIVNLTFVPETYYVAQLDIKNFIIRINKNFYKRFQGDKQKILFHILVHELCHLLLRTNNFNNIPDIIEEGICEYISDGILMHSDNDIKENFDNLNFHKTYVGLSFLINWYLDKKEKGYILHGESNT